jgi:hypothetical protein
MRFSQKTIISVSCVHPIYVVTVAQVVSSAWVDIVAARDVVPKINNNKDTHFTHLFKCLGF